MIIVLATNGAGPINVLTEAPPEQVLVVLQLAVQGVMQQLSGPKLIMPNGEAHVVPPEQTEP